VKLKERDWTKIRNNVFKLVGNRVPTGQWPKFLERIRMSTRLRFLPIRYKPGNCQGCGKCCSKYDVVQIDTLIDLGVPKDMQGPDPEPLANALLFGAMLRNPDGSCIAWDAETKRCKIYETRPRTCRRYFCSDEDKYTRTKMLKACDLPQDLRERLEGKRCGS